MSDEQDHSLESAYLDDAQVDRLLAEAEEHASAPPDRFAQALLLQMIGLLVVTAGHVEWGLCRAIRWLRHQPAASHDPDVERMGWQEFVRTIDALADESTDGRRVADVLNRHGVTKLMSVRHNLVHGRISVAGAPNFLAVRFPPKQRPVTIAGTTDDLHRMYMEMRKLSESLEAVMSPEYRRVMYDV